MSYIMIVGAKSDIAKSLARKFAMKGYNLYLACRNSEELGDFANDVQIRSDRDVQLVEMDVLKSDTHLEIYENLDPKPLGVVSVAGYLGDQTKAQADFDEAVKIMDSNYTGLVSILNIAANDMELKKSGWIIGISSVAGDRGRKSNYIYGSAKAAFTEYLSGLRNRLYDNNVHVMTVKPGFVDTKMTAGMDLPAKLTAQPDDVADDIINALDKKKNVIYTKKIWRLVMLIIRHIPEFQFKKMSI